MDTKPLESFAKAARRELIVAVEARMSAVLATGSVARSERGETVRLLEAEISDHGREHVIDRVAYTWFNRLIALRFMDARGYTDAGVVSPASGQAHGQPEILADAKRGDVDTEVVTNAGARKAIIGLLDGTRRSTDAEGEAYALLLTEYCRHWYKTMPFMFEAEGAYTELLVPAGLLADGALLSRARDVLTEDVCNDVEVIGWLYQFYISERKAEVFAGFKKGKKAGVDEIPAATQLFTPHWIVRYLLENSLGRLWMLNRPASRLVDRMDYYIAPIGEETDFLKVSGPEELTVIDPACGSGHMLTYAFDLLYAIYEEEGYAPSEIPSLILTHNLHGAEIDPRAGALASFALTMKARAMDRRFFTRSGVEHRSQPQIWVIEPLLFTSDELDLLITKDGDRDAEEAFWNQFRDADTLGSLIQPDPDATKRAAAALEELTDLEESFYYDTLNRARQAVAQADVLSRQYSVVTANPPYMGGKNMDACFAAFAKENFSNSKSDLFAMFIERCLDFLPVGGYSGLMTPFVWMFIASYEGLRKRVIRDETILSLIQLEYSGFDGATVPVCAYVLRRGRSDQIGAFVRLSDFVGPAVQGPKAFEIIQADRLQRTDGKSGGMERYLYRIAASEFAKLPGTPIAYWLPPQVLTAMVGSKRLGDVVSFPTSPHKTGDNNTYVRRWWEVSLGDVGTNSRWVPYAKGGGGRRWYGLMYDVVDWSPNARRFYKENSSSSLMKRSPDSPVGVTYSMLTSGTNTFRVLPPGAAFDMGGPAFYPSKVSIYRALAIANSDFTRLVLDTLNPTLNLQLREVKQIPVLELDADHADRIEKLGQTAVDLAARDWDSHECSLGFQTNPLISAGMSRLDESTNKLFVSNLNTTRMLSETERAIDRLLWSAADVPEVQRGAEGRRAIIFANVVLEYGPGKSADEYQALSSRDAVGEFVSYAVGCMFGRYSLDEPGLILADQGATLQDYLAKVRSTDSTSDGTGATSDVTFIPDADNVIPFVDDGWFEDDVVEQFRKFLKVAFGTEHFEANLRFIEESLGVKTLRDYFITKSGRSKFYDDHVQRYKKRPIYWMFSSPKGSFNALIYLHRYTPSTVSTVLNEYLREYENKLQKALERAEVAAAGGTSAKDQKEADRLRKVLAELRDYEHDVLYPLATQQVKIDLDDGVKVNYPKFYPAVKKIAGLEASDG
ncbi:BREX-1 system adenine-specific DNA-methyltransferase PglX [Rhodococcus ruber]|uniref:BREX-1 system adenine-specific DNA-methyltransferase PglX n=1 Tax=Rhodococcus ruber TaxID=1830 RepID=UPI0019348513|nr:BREX-1 system adenine-specific DNA-methyltransferase PglX [Rhodococcus ruber]QRE80541.1 BREX-1 system adenine-specific DNA-methyltransferase PglX [Rhodococcus ruber]